VQRGGDGASSPITHSHHQRTFLECYACYNKQSTEVDCKEEQEQDVSALAILHHPLYTCECYMITLLCMYEPAYGGVK
jgi:hypothetical protein